MIDRTTKLRWRRRFRRSKKQVEELGVQAEVGLEKHFFRRLSRLTRVRRFIAAWVFLFILTIGGVLLQTRALGESYLTSQPAAGGIFTEGILGTFTNANPIYASNSVDNSVTKLVFASLFKFDQNNQLSGDLAESLSVDARETTYTVKLKPNLKWHDGRSLTSDDVVYTYAMIQNPDAKSPLAASWQGIVVKAVDPLTVTFKLPSVLGSFPLSMTNGILPQHLLAGLPPGQLRSSVFNTGRPVGAGPFKVEAVEVTGINPEEREERIALVPNDDYHGKKPQLDRVIIRTFREEEKMVEALKKGELTAAAGLSIMPESLEKDISYRDYNIPLTSGVYVFLRNSNDVLSNQKVRKALAYGTNTNELLRSIGRPVLPLKSPLLSTQVGYDRSVVQTTGNIAEAQKLLDEAGWKLGPKGVRQNAQGQPLSFSLVSLRNSTYDYVTQSIKQQWQQLGVELNVTLQDEQELQTSLAFHNFDSLLYGIALGPDPDVFPYWHSSQADIRSANRLNFSEYKSNTADKSLEAGRTRNDATLRAIKYKPFLEAWRDDAPAIALYQPRYLYVTRGPIYNFSPVALNSASDRFNNVENWQIRLEQQPM